jgi:two-component system NtrC family sensor kinase
MKLAAKLTVFILSAMLLVFVARGYQAARTQMLNAENRVRDNALLVGQALRPALVEIWAKEGAQVARGMLAYTAKRVRRAQEIDLRLVRVDPSDEVGAPPRVAIWKLHDFQRDEERAFVETIAGKETLLTYLPIYVEGTRSGALEVTSQLSARDQEFQAELSQIFNRTLLAALAAFLAVAFAGYTFIARPMRRLVDKARRIGTGDLAGPLDLRQRDELGELAGEINHMCEQLGQAQARVEEETKRRLAASEQLRHADRLTTVGKLASGVAHELGTPLNVVSGRAKMILRGQVEGRSLLDSAQAIADQADRMTLIIKQLLGFARRRAPQRRRENLRGVIDRTLVLLRPMAEKSGTAITTSSSGAEPIAEIDASLIEQALTNLVVNALQAMPSGGTLTVETGQEDVSPAGTYVFLRVLDTGVGMSPEQLRHAFEPFFTTKDVGSGTGLGLSVAHGIVLDHGGWIIATSELNQGSCFTLYLPCPPPEESTP